VTDRGGGTVLVLVLGMLVVLGGVAGVVRGVAVVARHRVETAADLAALAGAAAALDGTGPACAAAGRVAHANGGQVSRCTVTGEVIEVVVTRPLLFGRLGRWAASGRARAGPASAELAARGPT
jgi:secretion/DNA translocation related TadE-like protein